METFEQTVELVRERVEYILDAALPRYRFVQRHIDRPYVRPVGHTSYRDKLCSISPELTGAEQKLTIAHELAHSLQMEEGAVYVPVRSGQIDVPELIDEANAFLIFGWPSFVKYLYAAGNIYEEAFNEWLGSRRLIAAAVQREQDDLVRKTYAGYYKGFRVYKRIHDAAGLAVAKRVALELRTDEELLKELMQLVR